MGEHCFALWLPTIDKLQNSFCGLYTISENEVVHRIKRVLRASVGDTLIFFGHTKTASIRVHELRPESIVVMCEQVSSLIPLNPELTVYLPLLEKAAFEEAIRAATVLGVTRICTFISEKTKRSELSTGECNRLERIMIAAAEQSKQLCFPILEKPIPLKKIVFDTITIMFDIHAQSLSTCVPFLSREPLPSRCALILGPEGDFTAQEREWLSNDKVICCQLTPTILRSEDAFMVGVGFIRSWFNRR